MHQSAQALMGEHDFSAFRSSGCSATHAVREVKLIDVHRDGDRVFVDVRANDVEGIAGHSGIERTEREVGNSGSQPCALFVLFIDRCDPDIDGVRVAARGWPERPHDHLLHPPEQRLRPIEVCGNGQADADGVGHYPMVSAATVGRKLRAAGYPYC